MIVIKIEMWPMGYEKAKYELGRAYMANDGTGTRDRGDYDIVVCRKGSDEIPAPLIPEGPKATRVGRVEDYPRLAYPMWRLIIRALKACYPEEK